MIDTDIWVAVERGTLAPADIHSITGSEPIFLSPVDFAELQMGVELVDDQATRRKARAAMKRLRRKPQLRMDYSTGGVFGRLAAALRKQGRREEFRVMDLWLNLEPGTGSGSICGLPLLLKAHSSLRSHAR